MTKNVLIFENHFAYVVCMPVSYFENSGNLFALEA